ncbi:MAG TPA: ribosomal protein S18-alanine N-acetyltransferase [Thermoanaerobaculia bacterium]|nr:ribosomal protein S18-alanine N-acetyltransferase [Thermoanaerobaculia bacterium]
MSALAESVTTRDAHAVDLDAIAALERAAFPVPWKREYFEVEIGAAHRFNRVAIGPRGDLAGYVFCAFAAGELHVNKIATDERHRRRGIASHLMDEVLGFAEAAGVEEVYLEVRVSNRPARAFYAGLGFREAGRRSRYYLDGEDALVLVRDMRKTAP